MVLRDAVLAWIHFVLIFSLAGCLCAEFALYRRVMDRAALALLGRFDSAYGALAGAIVASGILRVLYSPKGSAYFMHNPIFWMKMGLFVTVALLSIPPTIHFIRLRRDRNASEFRVSDGTFVRMRALMTAEAVVLLAIPLFAALMARGYR